MTNECNKYKSRYILNAVLRIRKEVNKNQFTDFMFYSAKNTSKMSVETRVEQKCFSCGPHLVFAIGDVTRALIGTGGGCIFIYLCSAILGPLFQSSQNQLESSLRVLACNQNKLPNIVIG